MKLVRLPYILGLMLAAGCNEIPNVESFKLSAVGADVACSSSSECSNDEVCVASRCVLVSDDTRDIALRLSFPDSKEVPVIAYRKLRSGSSIGDFAQPQMQNVSIHVKYMDAWLDGNLSISPADAWHGLDAEQKGYLSSKSKEPKPIRMMPGNYNITVFPTASQSDVPTMYFENIRVDENTDEIILDLSDAGGNMPVPGHLSLNYRVRNDQEPEAAASPEDPANSDGGTRENVEPQQPALSLVVMDADSPAASAHYALSADTNDFQRLDIALPPQERGTTRQYNIRIAQKVTQTLTVNQSMPTFPVVLPANEKDAARIIDVSKAPKTIDVRAFTAYEIRGRVISDAISPAGATVTLNCTANEFSWTSRAREATSSDGYFLVDVPIGLENSDCEIRIAYPTDSPLASKSVQVPPFGVNNLVVDVEEKGQLTGIVIHDATNEPIDNARLVFSPADHVGTDIEITSDEDGQFVTRLDAKIYNVTVSAPRADGLPEMVRQIDGANAQDVAFRVERGELVYGNCLAPDGAPIAEVRAEVFIQRNGTAQRLNVTESDENGTFRLFIPALASLEE